MTGSDQGQHTAPLHGAESNEVVYTLLGVVAFLAEELAWQKAIDVDRFVTNLRMMPMAGNATPEVQAIRSRVVELIAQGVESRKP